MTETRTPYTVHPFGWSAHMDLDAPSPLPIGEGINSQMINLATVFLHDADAYLLGGDTVSALWSLSTARHFINLVEHRTQNALDVRTGAKED